jgi:crotonobetainyl-CoA:carnitine CoA-transferase CaiB-like acyl-CoA transferase
MAGMTMTTQGSAQQRFGARQAQHGWLAVGALLVMAALVALLLAASSGPSARVTAVPAQRLVQEADVVDQATQPIYFPGRPY